MSKLYYCLVHKGSLAVHSPFAWLSVQQASLQAVFSRVGWHGCCSKLLVCACRIHKRLIDLHSPADVVKQITSIR